MRRTIATKTRTVAVLASVAALGGGATAIAATGQHHKSHAHSSNQNSTSAQSPAAGPGDLTAAECTALEAAQKAIQAQASSIATPVLDSYVNNGTITSAQEATLLALLEKGGPAGPAGPGGPGGHPGPGGPPPNGATGASGSS
jgi:hypothetical protein